MTNRLNYYRLAGVNTVDLATLILIFQPWLFKLAYNSSPNSLNGHEKQPDENPGENSEALFGLVDLELEDLEIYIPPHIWESLDVSQIEGPHLPR